MFDHTSFRFWFSFCSRCSFSWNLWLPLFRAFRVLGKADYYVRRFIRLFASPSLHFSKAHNGTRVSLIEILDARHPLSKMHLVRLISVSWCEPQTQSHQGTRDAASIAGSWRLDLPLRCQLLGAPGASNQSCVGCRACGVACRDDGSGWRVAH